MRGKIKWDFLSNYEKDNIFDDYKSYQEARKISKLESKEHLIKLFNAYNENVSFQYPKVNSSISCGKCVQNILEFFKREIEKCQNEEN